MLGMMRADSNIAGNMRKTELLEMNLAKYHFGAQAQEAGKLFWNAECTTSTTFVTSHGHRFYLPPRLIRRLWSCNG